MSQNINILNKLNVIINGVKERIKPNIKIVLNRLWLKSVLITFVSLMLGLILMKLSIKGIDYAYLLKAQKSMGLGIFMFFSSVTGMFLFMSSFIAAIYNFIHSFVYAKQLKTFSKEDNYLNLQKYKDQFKLTTEENTLLFNELIENRDFFVKCVEEQGNINYVNLITLKDHLLKVIESEKQQDRLMLEKEHKKEVNIGLFLKDYNIDLRKKDCIEEKELKYMYKEML